MAAEAEVTRTIGASIDRIVDVWPSVGMRGPDGTTFETSTPSVTEAPQTLDTTATAADGSFRFVARTELELVPDGDATRVTVRTATDPLPPEAAAATAGLDEAWTSAFEQLEGAVTGVTVDPGERSIAGTIEVDAPADVVWRLCTSPEHVGS